MNCRLRVTLPAHFWMRRFTVAHPAARVEVLDRLEVRRREVLFEVRVTPRRREGWGEELRRLPKVRSVEPLGAPDGGETFRIVYGGRTFLPLLKRLRLMRRFPFPIRAGVATWVVVAPEPRIRSLLRSLGRARVRYQVEAIRPGSIRPGPPSLTRRQQEILRRAVSAGYFDVPRRISLVRLAAAMGIASSTLSVALATIEKKIVGSVPEPEGAEPLRAAHRENV